MDVIMYYERSGKEMGENWDWCYLIDIEGDS